MDLPDGLIALSRKDLPAPILLSNPMARMRCPAGHPLTVQERRPERNGSVRVVYGARISSCRPCPLRGQCQESTTTKKPRQVSAVLWPIEAAACVPAQPPPVLAAHPVLWGDWPRSHLRRRWMSLLRTQTVHLTFGSAKREEMGAEAQHAHSRAQRAHWRLSWQERMARNARRSHACPLEVTIYGLPATFAQFFGLKVATAA